MIMATAIPQLPKTTLEEILCDADLDYLGRDDFYTIAADLRDELAGHGMTFSEIEWLQFEYDFIQNHIYFTATSKGQRDFKKQSHLKEIKNQLQQLANKK
jgi:hypothetical protein